MVNQQLLQPQEIEVFYILPTIRKYLSLYMKEQGLNQKSIAAVLFIRESTVSQYLNERRASQIEFNDKIKAEIKISAGRIKNRAELVRETQRLLNMVRTERVLCQIHRKISNLPMSCTLEKMGCK